MSYEDLPQELLNQLTQKTQLQSVLIAHINEEGPCDINSMLIGLYKRTGKVYKRSSVTTIVSLLRSAGEISRVSHGVYGPKRESTNELA